MYVTVLCDLCHAWLLVNNHPKNTRAAAPTGHLPLSSLFADFRP